MSRKAIDPVDRAFDAWRELTNEQQQRLADRQYGYWAAQQIGNEPPKRTRKPRRKAATETAE